jgi:hypothetical protein
MYWILFDQIIGQKVTTPDPVVVTFFISMRLPAPSMESEAQGAKINIQIK